MDDKLKSLMRELRVSAKLFDAGNHGSVIISERKIYDYLANLREAVQSEKTKPGASVLWTDVEEFIERLKPLPLNP